MIPTIGRPGLLRACLASVVACRPPAREVVVVDQSGDAAVGEVVGAFAAHGARVCQDPGRGRGRAVNRGLESAREDLVLITDDDCTVAPDWVAVGAQALDPAAGGIVTGRVLPAGDPWATPSTIVDEVPRDYTGTRARGVLFAGNMVCSRRELLAFGGFDERIVPSAEDNELCFRWLKARRGLRYEPRLTVWHHDWRTSVQLRELHRRYARGEGVFLGTHLRAGEWQMLTFLLSDLRGAARAHLRALVLRERPWWDWRLQIVPAMLIGVLEGLRHGPR